MENTFYQIEIGTETRKGNLLVAHSFVCGTENKNHNEVRQHFAKKYSGLNVRCNAVESVVFESIEKSASVDYCGVTQEEKKLKEEIRKLKLPQKGTSIIEDSLSWENFPKELYSKFELKQEEVSKIHGELKDAIKVMLKLQYSPFCESIRISDNIKPSTTSLDYEVILKGKIKTEFEDLK